MKIYENSNVIFKEYKIINSTCFHSDFEKQKIEYINNFTKFKFFQNIKRNSDLILRYQNLYPASFRLDAKKY